MLEDKNACGQAAILLVMQRDLPTVGFQQTQTHKQIAVGFASTTPQEWHREE